MHNKSAIFFKQLKEYWFLVTLLISFILTIIYMIVFQVTPWDKHREVKNQRAQVDYYTGNGYSLLEKGFYSQASAEFSKALEINSAHSKAVNGHYLADLFSDLSKPDWTAAAGRAISLRLQRYWRGQHRGKNHLIAKYQGDVYANMGNLQKSRDYYRKALQIKPDYPDALYSYGWTFYGGSEQADLDSLQSIFTRLTEADSFDYRGFHGLGYTNYLWAIHADDPESRQAYLRNAAILSDRGSRLASNQIHILSDLGEVARPILPDLSLALHKEALRLLQKPEIMALSNNRAAYHISILRYPVENPQVFVFTPEEKKSWIYYQIALDHLALQRINPACMDCASRHNQYLEMAFQLDISRQIEAVYRDQLSILNIFLPEQ
ncbi:MAG: tetratricopeptide repeat protein [Calditrichia bacterium]